MKECNNIEQQLWSYLENQLDNTEKALVEFHLQECKSCKELFHVLSEGLQQSKPDYIAANDPFFLTGILQKIENKHSTKHIQKNWLHVLRPITVSAFIISGCFLGIGIGNTISVNIANKKQKQEIIKKYAQENYYDEFNSTDVEQVLTLK